MTRSIRVVDVSLSASVPPLSWFQDIQKPPYNVEGIVIECWDNGPNSNYVPVSKLAAQASLPAATYAWPPSGAQSGAINHALRDGLHPKFFVLDVEKPENTSAAFCAIHRSDVDALKAAGLVPWCYSSSYEWGLVMGLDGNFSDLPLWNAGYLQGNPRWPDPAPLPPYVAHYGGWTSAQGWQCSGTTQLLGVDVDLSLWDAAAFGLEDDMTDEQMKELIKAIQDDGAKTREELQQILIFLKAAFTNIDGDTEAIKKKLGI